MVMISIASDFSRFPGGRYVTDGPHSGEKFRDNVLIPAFSKNEKVSVNLDGTRGYGSSFLEEAFGGLVRKGINVADINNKLEIITKDKTLKREILEYIKLAKDGRTSNDGTQRV